VRPAERLIDPWLHRHKCHIKRCDGNHGSWPKIPPAFVNPGVKIKCPLWNGIAGMLLLPRLNAADRITTVVINLSRRHCPLTWQDIPPTPVRPPTSGPNVLGQPEWHGPLSSGKARGRGGEPFVRLPHKNCFKLVVNLTTLPAFCKSQLPKAVNHRRRLMALFMGSPGRSTGNLDNHRLAGH